MDNTKLTTRTVIIRCLFYGSLTFGVWTALFFSYLHRIHKSYLQKTSQELSSAWSSEQSVQQQITQDSQPTSKAHVVVKNEPKKLRAFAALGKDFNYTDPEFLDGFSKYGFNTMISTTVGFERNVPDTRHKACLQNRYPVHLPTASVIICFHNEEFNALFRTMFSIVNLTPGDLLEEIILVDDMSEFGDVLVFLDSHCEVNRGWLEPLLYSIAKDRKTVVCPLIDVIDGTTLEYRPSPVVRGAFDWDLQFKWDNVFSYEMDGPDRPINPIRSPAMAGGIFAIYRHYFNEIGQYDKGMDLWGGENLELSLRIWMCGGQLFIIPCSRVGHIAKKQFRNLPILTRALTRNSLRMVHVWLDEYKEQFFLRKPGLRSVAYGNISERVELRKRLGCKSFQWYLDTVFPELEASLNSS
ncbi:inactive polypeptide N-acetylgalactosaminyltransferase-like protein 5 isoform X2 [Nycticebus coucang]|uniref:inactive polypeptide N-acetylgalactosaminyltransferase-like protein 5 isoform X2 n=1 Tax=Nycticebus coucang TaxID=9470 RepID=UPI00234DE186|nr:inactive polypeptide N-acetylgalactosaminyltransferase-like protein 5 isoform X2 [Nycticebus coucang]